MARFTPAACSPCAIAQAMERLLATPNTTAVRPFKSSNMNASPFSKKKNNSIPSGVDTETLIGAGGGSLPRWDGPAGAAEGHGVDGSDDGKPCWDGPAGAAEGHGVDGSDDGKPCREADLGRHPAHAQAERYLEERAEKIERVLDASHEMLRHLFDHAGIHGDAAVHACRSHQRIQQDGERKPGRKRRKRHGKRKQKHGQRDRTARTHPCDQSGSVKRARECADTPSAIEPSVTLGSGVKYAIAERRRDYDSSHHRAQE